jgi:hypothetical protein
VKDAFDQGLFLIYKVFLLVFARKGFFYCPEIKKAGFWPDNILNLPEFSVNVNSFQHIANKICFLHKRKAAFS